MIRVGRGTWQAPLGAGLITLSALAGAAALGWLAWWIGLDRRYFDSMGMAAWMSALAGLLYLAVTTIAGFAASWHLRRGDTSVRVWSWMATAHAVVFIAAVLVAVRGPASRAHLASLHYLIAALAVTSCLGWIISLAARWLGRGAGGTHSDEPNHRPRWAALLLLAGFLVAGSLAYLEARSLPTAVDAASHAPHLGGP